MRENDFYIGYLKNAPPSVARLIKLTIVVLAILIPSIAFLIVTNQSGFSTSTFEFGKYTTIKGELVEKPVPMLRLKNGNDIYGNAFHQSVLLVGFGKFGAAGAIRKMENEKGIDLDGKMLELSGTLIYHDGMSLLELSEGKNALIQYSDVATPSLARSQSFGTATLQGEIIDPKCYFGVMKPGEGKPHRSCAIRCISGGIPPMLKVSNEEGASNYYVLLGPNGEPVNTKVLPYIAEPVKIMGELERSEDLLLLKMNGDIKRVSSPVN